MALIDAVTLDVLGKTADDTTNTWAANAIITRALTTPYRAPTTKRVYVGLLQNVSTSVGTYRGATNLPGAMSGAPVMLGNADTGLTTPASLPATLAVSPAGAANQIPYVGLS